MDIERHIERIPITGCWLWVGRTDRGGYGKYGANGLGAHRIVYEKLKGKIPEGLVLDHLCRVRCCVNPDHLEPVSIAENNRRSAAYVYDIGAINRGVKNCKRGHEFTPENTKILKQGWRQCITCKKMLDKRRNKRKLIKT